jgi:hypothetical protein
MVEHRISELPVVDGACVSSSGGYPIAETPAASDLDLTRKTVLTS